MSKIEDLLKVLAMLDEPTLPTYPFTLGTKVFIRTVTHYYLGKVKDWYSDFVVLEDASWVADTGRFADFLARGEATEVEPFVSPVLVSRAAIVDMTEWAHALPREQK